MENNFWTDVFEFSDMIGKKHPERRMFWLDVLRYMESKETDYENRSARIAKIKNILKGEAE